ncbi:acetyltransferase [Pigmentibacter ruber]|uniref:acetyltransferase n=1 Tax=Pigmentibacter ruber TaxID=2683196 RepID=UPI00131B13D6|nr:acetyltransferase [Pigmentibacter ruber]
MNYSQLPVVIIGAGGHAKVVADTLQAMHCEILGYTNTINEKPLLNLEYLGSDDFIMKQNPKNILLVIGFGSVKFALERQKTYEKWKALGFNFKTLIHPSASISRYATIGEGTQVLMGVLIQACASIKDNCIINTGASIDHDCFIDNHCHIAPRVSLSGGVTISTNCHIGTGSVVIQNIHIENNVTVGAGSVVIKNIASNSMVYGVPAK